MLAYESLALASPGDLRLVIKAALRNHSLEDALKTQPAANVVWVVYAMAVTTWISRAATWG